MRKLDSIESLRGWMAWWVVLGHAIYLSGCDIYFSHMPFKLLAANGYAVNVFMVISGFVITHLVAVRRESYPNYIAKRGWRLFPLMAAMIALSVLTRDLYYEAYVANPWVPEAAERKMRFLAEQHAWPRHLLLHVTMLHGMIPNQILPFAGTTFLAPAWSISLEWQFYLVAPLLVSAMIVPSLRSVCVIMLALALSFASLSGVMGTWQYESFLPLALVYFMVGITLRFVLGRARDGLPTPWQPILVTLLGMGVYGASKPLSATIFDLGLLSCICVPFFLITAVEAEVIACRSKVLEKLAWLLALNPVVIAMGRVSYSTYLCHIPVLTIVVGGAMLVTGNTSHASIIGWTSVAVLLVVPVSFLCYRWIEAPALALGRRYLSSGGRKAVDPGLQADPSGHV